MGGHVVVGKCLWGQEGCTIDGHCRLRFFFLWEWRVIVLQTLMSRFWNDIAFTSIEVQKTWLRFPFSPH